MQGTRSPGDSGPRHLREVTMQPINLEAALPWLITTRKTSLGNLRITMQLRHRSYNRMPAGKGVFHPSPESPQDLRPSLHT
ncbi:hypothetical protein PsYK624_033680 [Phanerochaete sordida]|uniref:Uncharacterized protein n=1 Tax=Phanerochaete sordida TaxID=48140 RepID=A0A9P3G464_9APHY|nr:hypothetical protein PsYK624_033680 [Phanerochaete sordida]